MIQVQKGAPARLLIGTDLLSKLGFLFVQTEQEEDDVDLLEEQDCLEDECEVHRELSREQETDKQVGTCSVSGASCQASGTAFQTGSSQGVRRRKAFWIPFVL